MQLEAQIADMRGNQRFRRARWEISWTNFVDQICYAHDKPSSWLGIDLDGPGTGRAPCAEPGRTIAGRQSGRAPRAEPGTTINGSMGRHPTVTGIKEEC